MHPREIEFAFPPKPHLLSTKMIHRTRNIQDPSSVELATPRTEVDSPNLSGGSVLTSVLGRWRAIANWAREQSMRAVECVLLILSLILHSRIVVGSLLTFLMPKLNINTNQWIQLGGNWPKLKVASLLSTASASRFLAVGPPAWAETIVKLERKALNS